MRSTLLLGVLAFCLFSPSSARAESKTEYEDRLTSQVTMVLDKYLGVGMSQVVVLVDGEPGMMGPPAKKAAEAPAPANKKKQEKPPEKNNDNQMLWSDYANNSRRSLMPGFTARQQMVVREEPKPQLPADPQKKEPEKDNDSSEMDSVMVWKIKRILVSIVLDHSVDDASAQKVGAMVMDMLGLDPDRGDKLNVYKLPLKSPWDLLISNPSSWSGPAKWGAIALLVMIAGWALYRIVSSLRKKQLELDINKSEDELEKKKEELEGEAEEEKPLEPVSELAAALNGDLSALGGDPAQKNGKSEPRKPFGFVTGANARLLGEIMAKDPDAQLAVLTSFLDPGLGGLVLKQLDPQKRKKVLLTMSNASHIPASALKTFEQEVEARLQNAVGGTEALSDLISQMDPKEQNEIVKDLWQRDQALATKLYHMIFRFEDLFQLPERDLRILAESTPMADWVAALSGAYPSYIQALAKVLPEETREVFNQHVEMGGAKGNGADVQWKILKVAKELKAQGRIQLKKPLSSPQQPGPDLPAAPGRVKTANNIT